MLPFERRRAAAGPTRLLTVRLTEAEHVALATLAAALGVSRSDAVRMALGSLWGRRGPTGAAGDAGAPD